MLFAYLKNWRCIPFAVSKNYAAHKMQHMFASKLIVMNQYIINIVEKSVLITFNEVVEIGVIEVWSLVGKSTLVYTKEIHNTNFENLPLNLDKGKYRIEIFIDGQQISKTININ